jgi:hypothetical protein
MKIGTPIAQFDLKKKKTQHHKCRVFLLMKIFRQCVAWNCCSVSLP